MNKYLMLVLFLFITSGCTATGQKVITQVVKKTCETLTQYERQALKDRVNIGLANIGAEYLGVKCPKDK